MSIHFGFPVLREGFHLGDNGPRLVMFLLPSDIGANSRMPTVNITTIYLLPRSVVEHMSRIMEVATESVATDNNPTVIFMIPINNLVSAFALIDAIPEEATTAVLANEENLIERLVQFRKIGIRPHFLIARQKTIIRFRIWFGPPDTPAIARAKSIRLAKQTFQFFRKNES